jgi:hypothetical protein
LPGFAAVVLLASSAVATPIRPDPRKLVKDAGRPREFLPARVGWNGPETRGQNLATNPVLAEPAAIRASLIAAALPDPRAVLAVVVAILLLRRLRHNKGPQLRAAPPQPGRQLAA